MRTLLPRPSRSVLRHQLTELQRLGERVINMVNNQEVETARRQIQACGPRQGRRFFWKAFEKFQEEGLWASLHLIPSLQLYPMY